MASISSRPPVTILLGLVRQDDQAVFRAAVRLPNLERRLRLVGLATTANALVDLANVKAPDIIVIDADVPELDAIAVARELIERGLYSAIVFVSDEESPEKIDEAMKAGVEEYFLRPLDARAVAKHLIEIAEVVERRRARRVHEIPEEVKRPPKYQVIGLTAAKGGIGKSTIAANLSVALAQEANAKVALVDLHIGDCAVLLNVMPKLSLQQLPDDLGEIDATFLNPYVATHSSGVSVFVSATEAKLGLPMPLSLEKIEKFIEALRNEYEFVVLDAPAVAYSTDLALFALVDLVILITVPWDVLSLRVTAALVESLKRIYDLDERVRLVLNRSQQKVTTELPDGKIEERLGMRIWERIPNATNIIIASINKGEPFVISQPDSDVSKAIRRLARKIAGLPVQPEKQKRFLFF
ncbi:MAG: P-loop NTPase [Armatimonadota bacterium]|nr:P-loop NTPase [Armatimonadota bacterium]MCX7777664.1 P-loop NTPase [Armatimonadota bacterium]MDW8025910.1 P-loop NTPase [Armatimonadota bacterium]